MSKKVLLSASWCGPCMVLKRRLESEKIQYEYLDIDDEEGRNLAIKHKVNAVPTLLVVEDDESFYTTRGADDIIEELKKNV